MWHCRVDSSDKTLDGCIVIYATAVLDFPEALNRPYVRETPRLEVKAALQRAASAVLCTVAIVVGSSLWRMEATEFTPKSSLQVSPMMDLIRVFLSDFPRCLIATVGRCSLILCKAS